MSCLPSQVDTSRRSSEEPPDLTLGYTLKDTPSRTLPRRIRVPTLELGCLLFSVPGNNKTYGTNQLRSFGTQRYWTLLTLHKLSQGGWGRPFYCPSRSLVFCYVYVKWQNLHFPLLPSRNFRPTENSLTCKLKGGVWWTGCSTLVIPFTLTTSRNPILPELGKGTGRFVTLSIILLNRP